MFVRDPERSRPPSSHPAAANPAQVPGRTWHQPPLCARSYTGPPCVPTSQTALAAPCPGLLLLGTPGVSLAAWPAGTRARREARSCPLRARADRTTAQPWAARSQLALRAGGAAVLRQSGHAQRHRPPGSRQLPPPHRGWPHCPRPAIAADNPIIRGAVQSLAARVCATFDPCPRSPWADRSNSTWLAAGCTAVPIAGRTQQTTTTSSARPSKAATGGHTCSTTCRWQPWAAAGGLAHGRAAC
jgi:hypothetical protein